MEFEPVEGLPPLHETPLGVVKIASPSVFVDVDDEGENRVRLIFRTYQAVRMTTTELLSSSCGFVGHSENCCKGSWIYVGGGLA